MSKYDCSKTLDYVHERNRMCGSITIHSCVGCPLRNCNNCDEISDFEEWCIEAVQKWSDGHPETPKIKKREIDFIAMFKTVGNKRITRDVYGNLYFEMFDEFIKLQDAWFDCIGMGESMTFEELLKLEVEEDE